MPEAIRMDRTWLCSVLFMDIANYSSQSVELQINLKQRFNQYLTDALHDVPESERVILDTGDGAAICFLGAPETAMFTALRLWQSFIQDKQQQHGLRVRLGVNLGPVKLVKDINGSLNAIGDGMNAGQRIMSFAGENQILVSQSYYEVVSRLSDDYKTLFRLKGTETDKHVREHTVYHLLPPSAQPAPALEPVAAAAAPAAITESAAPRATAKNKIWIVAGIAALLALVAFGASQFLKSPAPTVGAVAKTVPPVSFPPLDPPSQVQSPPPAASAPAPKPAAAPAVTPPVAATKAVVVETGKEAPERDDIDSDSAPFRGGDRPAPSVPSAAFAEFQQGLRLVNANNAADALSHFDKALAIDPNYVDAHVGRAEARRMLNQYDLSVPDCNSIIRIDKDDPRGYNCRGLARKSNKNYDAAIADFSQAIKLNPRFVAAYFDRANTYTDLKQYAEAIRDYTEGLRLRPRNVEYHLRRAKAWADLKQFDKAIEDYTEVIRLEPQNLRAFRGRAVAEDGMGDAAGAAADRKRANEAEKARARG